MELNKEYTHINTFTLVDDVNDDVVDDGDVHFVHCQMKHVEIHLQH